MAASRTLESRFEQMSVRDENEPIKTVINYKSKVYHAEARS